MELGRTAIGHRGARGAVALVVALPLAACMGNVISTAEVAGTGGRTGAPDAVSGGAGGAPSSPVDAGSGGAPVVGLGGAPGSGASIDAGSGSGGRGGGGGGGVGPLDARADAAADAPNEGTTTSPALCPASALVCDDFEDGNLDGWTTLPSGGTITVDTTHARSGTSALSINIPGNQRGGFIERKGAPLFPLPAGQLFGRVMVYFDSVPDGHSDIVRGAPVGGSTPWYNVGEQHGEILLNYYNGAASDCWARPSPGRRVPIQTWMCWEWIFDSTRNEMQFFIDGVLSRRVTGTGDGCLSNPAQTWFAPTFGSLRLGEYIAEISATPTRIWLDDVALGTTGRLGCPP